MHTDSFKAMAAGETIRVGHWVSISSTMVMEIMSRLGADFLLIDGEHSAIRAADLPGLLAAASLNEMLTVYRVRSQHSEEIATALDAGVSTLMVPMIKTAEEARVLVAKIKYPPEGRRGIGPWRASNYYDDFDSYLKDANERTTLIVQIECKTGLENVEEIAAVQGVDVLFVGPADLSASLGLPIGQMGGELLNACERAAAAADRHGKIAAIDLADGAYYAPLVKRGFTCFIHGADVGFLQRAGREQVSEFRNFGEPPA